MKVTLFLTLLIGVFMSDAGAEPIFQSTSPSALSISGSASKALKIAFDKFAAGGKDMLEFDVIISERLNEDAARSEDILIVTFMGKLAPGKRGLGTANRISGSVSYFISRKSWEVIKEQGIK